MNETPFCKHCIQRFWNRSRSWNSQLATLYIWLQRQRRSHVRRRTEMNVHAGVGVYAYCNFIDYTSGVVCVYWGIASYFCVLLLYWHHNIIISNTSSYAKIIQYYGYYALCMHIAMHSTLKNNIHAFHAMHTLHLVCIHHVRARTNTLALVCIHNILYYTLVLYILALEYIYIV